MIDVRLIISSVFKHLYLSRPGEMSFPQTEFSIYMVEQFSSIPFDSTIFELRIGLKNLAFS